MSGVDSLAAAILRAAEPSPLPPVAVGVIDRITTSGDGFLAWVSGATQDVLVISSESMSDVFIAKTQAVGVTGMTGRRVVVLFASRQALIAHSLGV